MIIGNSVAAGPLANLRPGNSAPPSNGGGDSSSGADSANSWRPDAGAGAAPATRSATSGGQGGSSYAGGSGYDGPARAGGYSASVTAESRPAAGMGDYSPPSSNIDADREAAMKMHATARIMAQVATIRQVDDVSAYALFDRPSDDTDAYRHAAAAYSENSE